MVFTFAAGFSRNRVSVPVAVGVAVVLRVAFAALTSRPYTPTDVQKYFHLTANLVLNGQDPVQDLAGRQWNFLELMPFVHVAELKTGLPWVYAVKIVPIIADCVTVWIISRLATSDARNRALQYAVNPLSLLVVSLHGQVEPIALALALGGILMLRARRPFPAGVLLGAAVAAKTWPVLILVAVLPLRDIRRAGRIVLGAAVVPVICLLVGMAVLDTKPFTALGKIVSYSSFVEDWTWSGTLIALGHHHSWIGYNSPVSLVTSLFMLTSVVIVLVLLRNRPPQIRVMAALAAVLIVTSGFGVQYLLWPLPLVVAISQRWRLAYIASAGGWAAAFYLSPAAKSVLHPFLAGMSWLPATVLFLVIAEQVGPVNLSSSWLRLRQFKAARTSVRPAPDATENDPVELRP